MRLRVGEPIAASNESPEMLHALGIGARQQVLQAGSNQFGSILVAVHSGHRVVTLCQPAMGIEVIDLCVLDQSRRERLVQLDPPDALGGLLDEAAVALLAG